MMKRPDQHGVNFSFLLGSVFMLLLIGVARANAQTTSYEFNDSHFHLTNNVQKSPNIHYFLGMTGI
jgi:hypothetical protein